MKRITEASRIRDVLSEADTMISSADIKGVWAGVAIETASEIPGADGLFEGTLVYFPGVTLEELKGQ